MSEPIFAAHDALLLAQERATAARSAMHADPASVPLALAYARAADIEATLHDAYEDLVADAMALEHALESAANIIPFPSPRAS